MLGCGFTFKAYVKKVREKTTKWSLKTAEVLLDAKYSSSLVISFKVKILCDVRSEIHLVRRNIISTGQSVRTLKKYVFRLGFK